jgi:hypothetical protein
MSFGRELDERIAAFAALAQADVDKAVDVLGFKEAGTPAAGHAQAIRRQLKHASRELAMLQAMVGRERRKQ